MAKIKKKTLYSQIKLIKLFLYLMIVLFVVLLSSKVAYAKSDSDNIVSDIPSWVKWNDSVIEDSISVDNKLIKIALLNKSLSFSLDDKEIWKSPNDIYVQDYLWADVDHDNDKELMILCWRIGRFGAHKPFWIKEDEKDWSQHIYIYECETANSKIRQKWLASNIGRMVKRWAFNDKGFLVLESITKDTSLWYWERFGLKNYPNDPISFVAVGDNLIHKPIYEYGLKNNADFTYLYENVKDIISEADVSIINNETMLVDDPALYGTYPCFGTPVQVGEAVLDAGFDIMSCATNHSLDRGKKGIDSTISFYDSNDAIHLGIQSSEDQDVYRPYVLYKVKGMTVAFYNYTYGTNGIPLPKNSPNIVHLLSSEERIREDLMNVPDEADFTIVCVHWGTEYNTGIDAYQKKWARVFSDCGADVVIGTHPHVLEPFEMVDNTLVYYSLGNFMSYQNKIARVVGGMAQFDVEYTIDGYKVKNYDLKGTVTHQIKGSGGKTTVYMLDDYTEDIAKEHVLGLSVGKANEIYEAIMVDKK